MSSNSVVPLRTGGKVSGIIPTTIEEVFRLATAIAKSGLAPSTMNTPEKLTVAIMHGLEVGMPPMMAVNRIAVVNGRLTLYGDAIPALLLANGFRLREWMVGVQGSTRCAICEVTRPDGSKTERSFTELDAMTAGLLGKAGPWKQYPDRMLQMRARGFAARDGAADVLSGLYLREEIEEEPMRDITPRAAMPDIPEIPDVPDDTKPDPTIEEDEPIDDAAGLLEKLRADLDGVKVKKARQEIWDDHEDLISRLDDACQRQAQSIFEGR